MLYPLLWVSRREEPRCNREAVCEVADLLFVRAKPASIWVLQESEAGRKFCVLLGASVVVTAFIITVSTTDLSSLLSSMCLVLPQPPEFSKAGETWLGFLGTASDSTWLLWACYGFVVTRGGSFLVSRCILRNVRGVLVMGAIARRDKMKDF